MKSLFQYRQIDDVVLDVTTWNPVRDGHEQLIRYIDLSSVDQDTKVIHPKEPIVAREAPSRARQLVQAGDVLVSTVRPNLNGVAMVDENLDGATASTGFCILRPQKEDLDRSYLFHWVKTPDFISDMVRKATGASYPAVSDRIILESKIPLPSIAQQKRIAAILDQAEELRGLRRQALGALDAIAQSIFLEMFGDVGEATRYPIHPLESLLEKPLQNGAYFPKDFYVESGGVEMVHMSDAFYEVVSRGNLKQVACTDEECKKYSLTEKDLLIARRSLNYEGAAKACLVPPSSTALIFESSFIRITPDPEKISVLFLFHYFSNERVRQRYIRPFVTQSTISGINQSNLARVSVIMPPLPLQQEFSRRVEAIEQLKTTHRQSLTQLDALFASLQHRAFRGEL